MKDKINILNQINEIKKGNEFIPEDDDTEWKKINHYFIYKNPPKIEYEINNEMIKQAKECLKLQSKLKKNNLKDDEPKTLFKIYKLYNETHSMISYTSTTIYGSLIDKIINSLKTNTEIPYLKTKLLAIYKGEIDRKELNLIKKEYENLDQNKDSTSIIELYEELIKKMIKKTKNKLDEKDYYIYKITKKEDSKRQYIYGTTNKLKGKDIKKILNDNNIELGKTVKFKLIEQFTYNYTCEAYIKIDKLIYENETLNKYYYIINKKYKQNDYKEIEKDIFLLIQTDIMKETYEDNNKYTEDGYIACIETLVQDRKQKYLFYGFEDYTIKNKLNELYSIGRMNNTQYNKIVDILYKTQFDDLKIYLVEQNIPKEELLIKYNTLINKMHTYDELN